MTGTPPPTRDELMARLAAAHAEEESVVMALVWLELGELLTNLGAAEDQAAAHLRDACKALEEPEAELAALDREITQAEGRCVQWSQQLSDEDPDTRAAARMHYQEWSAEVASRRAKRDQAERGYRDLFAAREEARTRLRIAQAAKERIMLAQLAPFADELAQATDAYRALRMPMLLPVLLRNDRESPEWPCAIEELRELCLRSAYRTDDLPSEAEQAARAAVMAMADAATTLPDPAPSMVELKMLDDAHHEHDRLQGTREVIDDRRLIQPVRTPPARSHMDVPRVRDMGLR